MILYLFFNGNIARGMRMYNSNTSRDEPKEAERERQARFDNLSQPNPPEKSLTGTTNCPGLVDDERIPFLDQTAQHQTVSQLPSDTGTPKLGDSIYLYIVMDLDHRRPDP